MRPTQEKTVSTEENSRGGSRRSFIRGGGVVGDVFSIRGWGVVGDVFSIRGGVVGEVLASFLYKYFDDVILLFLVFLVIILAAAHRGPPRPHRDPPRPTPRTTCGPWT